MINKDNIVSVTKEYNDSVFMNTYKVVYNTDQECFVPLDTANTDYQAIQDWVADGNTITDPNAE